jgi:hypothetical protein
VLQPSRTTSRIACGMVLWIGEQVILAEARGDAGHLARYDIIAPQSPEDDGVCPFPRVNSSSLSIGPWSGFA